MSRDEPERDAEDYASREPEIIGYCTCCKEPIYKWDDYYKITEISNDLVLHDDCGLDWLRQFKKYGD